MSFIPVSFWRKASDFAVRFIAPVITFVALFIGWGRGFEFDDLRQAHPDWAGLFNALENWVLTTGFFVCAFFTMAVSVITAIRQKSLSSLSTENDAAKAQITEIGNNIKNLFDGILVNLAKKLEFDQDTQARVSVYVHDRERSRFIPCGRYSPNPELRKPGRTQYPDNEGCIARGWRTGWYFDNAFPVKPSRRVSYVRQKYGIPAAAQRTRKMQSRLYAVKRLDCAMGGPLAVIVVEALRKGDFKENFLKEKLDGFADDLTGMIRTLRVHIPTPTDATERGL